MKNHNPSNSHSHSHCHVSGAMKNRQLCSSDDEADESRSPDYCWWRSDLGSKTKPIGAEPSARARVVRELERLALVAQDGGGINELRHKLVTYRSGDFWMPAGGVPKEKTDIPPVATVLLVGFAGCGKSSLVNLMYCVLGRSGLIPFAHTVSGNSSNYTSMFLEEHNVVRSLRSGFCVYDSRGFEYDNTNDITEELSSWINDGVHHNQLCLRPCDYIIPKEELQLLMSRSSPKFARRRVNCTLVVADVAEIYNAYKVGDFKPLEATKELFCSAVFKKCAENPILILTHGDKLTAEERIEARITICQRLNISETSGVYDIVCLTEYGFIAEDSDPVSAYALTEAIYRALLVSDRTHQPKRNLLDWTILVLSWIMCFVAALFACLADLCARLGDRDGRLRL